MLIKRIVKLEKKIDFVSQHSSVQISAGNVVLNSELILPAKDGKGIVVFAQEPLLSRHSNIKTTADILNKNKLGTLLPDLARITEETHPELYQLAERLESMAHWAHKNPDTGHLSMGYFAADESTEAAIIAAARTPELVKAVVIRGGTPDEVMEFLPMIKAPVLLIASGDPESVRSNQLALEGLNKDSAIKVVSGASQSFHEPGVAEEAAQLAAMWFLKHLE